MMSSVTDWDSYYKRPAPTTSITRKITERLIIRLLKNYVKTGDPIRICEIGGANSCFARSIIEQMHVAHYHVVDHNSFGLQLFAQKFHDKSNVTWEKADILNVSNVKKEFDVVFSVGLIEHFDVIGTSLAIANHFKYLVSNGVLLITFPTPTLVYRGARMTLETAGLWQFPDERPLSFEEVEKSMSSFGTVVEKMTNHAIILAQGIIVARS